jgi:hypothetical protein
MRHCLVYSSAVGALNFAASSVSRQLQELLLTYFGAMRHCLVCSSTVGALDFAASSVSVFGIPWEVIPEFTEATERRLTLEQRRRERPMKRLRNTYESLQDPVL